MSAYLIEIPHPGDKIACLHAIKVFLESGSHFLVNADWGCQDGEHKAWMVVDVDNKSQALQIVPPLFRHEARIIKLVKYTREGMKEGLKDHEAELGKFEKELAPEHPGTGTESNYISPHEM